MLITLMVCSLVPFPSKTLTLNYPLITEGFIDWFIPKEVINNRTGKWFVGVISIKDSYSLENDIIDMGSCEENSITKDWLDTDFKTETYIFQAYTGGCYFFNRTTEIWESNGLTVSNICQWFTMIFTIFLRLSTQPKLQLAVELIIVPLLALVSSLKLTPLILISYLPMPHLKTT